MRYRVVDALLVIGGAVLVAGLLRLIADARPAVPFDMETIRPADLAAVPADPAYAALLADRYRIIGGYAPPTLTITVRVQDGPQPIHYIDARLSRFDAADLLLASTPEERQRWLVAVLEDAQARWPGERVEVALSSTMTLPARPYDGPCSVTADTRTGLGWEQTHYYAYASWPDPVDEYAPGVFACVYPE